jgi:hypothetical protein
LAKLSLTSLAALFAQFMSGPSIQNLPQAHAS